MQRFVARLFAPVLILVWFGVAPAAVADEPTQPSVVVFLVRHAEKVLGVNDPPLTPEGEQRAQLLAATLRDSSVDVVYSSDYKRTQDTARPTAARLGVNLQLYDAGDLEPFAEEILREGGRVLVVGHSNTTPEMVRLLGGKPGTPIEEGDEYDRLYMVTVHPSGAVDTLVLLYGRPPAGH